MEPTAVVCRLCASERVEPFARESRDGWEYVVVRCRACGVIQTRAPLAPVSPDYVALGRDRIDADRLWGQSDHKRPAFRQWQRVTRPVRPGPPGTLLDIGCGTGGFLRFAASRGWRVYGFDASQAQAEHARATFPEVRCSVGCADYLAQLGQPEQRFDMVTLWDVLEHVRDPRPFLEEIRAVLAPGGVLFISVPGGGALPMKRAFYRLLGRPFSLDPWEHVFHYTRDGLERLLREQGFVVEASGAVACYPRPWSPFEALRRTAFFLLEALPDRALQIYCVARRADGG